MGYQQSSVNQRIDDLKKNNKLDRLLLESAKEAFYFYSMEGKLIYVNPAFFVITGYTTDELYDQNVIPFVHPDDQAWTGKMWEALFHGESIDNIEYRIVKKDGEIRWSESSWSFVLDNDGTAIGVQGKQLDISKRKDLEKEKELLLLKLVTDVKEMEKHMVFKATTSSTQHILNNLLTQMQWFMMKARESDCFDEDTLNKYVQVMNEGKELVDKLCAVQDLSVENIKSSVKPVTGGN